MNDLLIAGLTDVGQRRKDNQDTFICTPLWSESNALLAVIDGVGGYAGGDRAAAIAREAIERYMATPNGDPLSMLREAVVFANNQINEQRQQDLKLGQMCCVLTAALADISTNKLYYAHVGDTRLYRYRRGELTKLTHDHSLVGVREDANELTEAEAMAHPAVTKFCAKWVWLRTGSMILIFWNRGRQRFCRAINCYCAATA